MKPLVKLGYLAAACALLVSTFAMIGPRAVRATVAALVRDVDNRDRATIESLNCNAVNLPMHLGFFQCSPSFTVPAGQRFVIDEVDGSCQTAPGSFIGSPLFQFTTEGVDARANLVLTPQPAEGGGFLFWNFNQLVHYIADPGSTVSIGAFTNDVNGHSSCGFNISGRLVSYP